MNEKALQETNDRSWILEQEGFAPSEEREMESLFAIGNGYLGVRGSPDFLIPASQPDLFIAGVYDKKATSFPYSEPTLMTTRERNNPYSEIVPFPFPFHLEIRLDGALLELTGDELKEHGRRLDMRKALYFEDFKFADKMDHRIRVKTIRCACATDSHLLFQQVFITSENFSGHIEVGLSLYARDLGLEYPHLKQLKIEKPNGITELECYATQASKIQSCFASRIFVNGLDVPSPKNVFQLTPTKPIRLQKIVSVFSGTDTGRISKAAIEHAKKLTFSELDQKLQSHAESWNAFWDKNGIAFRGRNELTHAERFNLYHLEIPIRHDPEATNTSIGARALTGRAYEGHVFWDTEIFMFPYYLYTQPHRARELLLYRYGTLPAAKRRAKNMNCNGACFAWESTLTGEDVTPRAILIKGTEKEIPIFTGTQQLHVSADIAYSVWKYWDATLDQDFMQRFGVEILVETARFWASRVNEEDSVYHIRNVIGPDEYHFSVNNNAYTNWMVRLNLEKAVWAIQWLQAEFSSSWNKLSERLRIDPSETQNWIKISHQLVHPKKTPEGVLEQFDGFFELENVELPDEHRMKAPINRLFSWDRINRMKLVKQADVLMLPFLFPDSFSTKDIAANYHYYEPITDHGSSLSVSVHAAIAARAGLMNRAQDYWEKSLYFDLQNRMHNTQLGVHPGCMGGTWQALVFHILGARVSADGIEVSTQPWLPNGCTSVEFDLIYRGKRLSAKVQSQRKAAA